MNVDYSGQADAALPQPLAQTLPETVGEATWRRIRSDIIAGSLAPGKKLKLDTMRTSYGASVSTLREALNRLASEGYVIAEGQKGFEVAPVSIANLHEIAALRLLIEKRAITDSFARGEVEWEARVVAAYHKLAAMEHRLALGEIGVAALWNRYDSQFHQALISACGSKALMRLHAGIFDKYLRYQMIALSRRDESSAAEHRAMHDAALKRDAAKAHDYLEQHIKGGVEAAASSGAIQDCR